MQLHALKSRTMSAFDSHVDISPLIDITVFGKGSGWRTGRMGLNIRALDKHRIL